MDYIFPEREDKTIIRQYHVYLLHREQLQEEEKLYLHVDLSRFLMQE